MLYVFGTDGVILRPSTFLFFYFFVKNVFSFKNEVEARRYGTTAHAQKESGAVFDRS